MVTSLATVPARAGGEETTDKEARRLSRLWRSEGAKALPGVLTALCSDASDAFVRAAAEDFLVEIGPTSVEALLDRAVSGQCASNVDIVGSTLPRAICADLTKQKRSLPPASTARLLRPIVAALDGLDEARAVVSLKVVARASVHDPCPLWPAVVKAVAGPATRLLARVNERHRGEVLAALASLGPAAAPALPIATSLLDDAPARPAALLLLGSIGPASAPSVPRITQILDSAKEPAAAEALGMIGTPALPALPKLLSLLSDASGDGCRKPPLPMNVLIGAIAALAESAPAGSSLRNDAVAALRTARQGCPKLDTWFAGALERLGVH
jgi:hypothetical protein